MGQFHAKYLSRNRRASFVGVFDTNAQKARDLARRYRISVLPTLSELPANVDAAIVATPTPSHFAIGSELLGRGIACLIEKPVASSLSEADHLIDLADRVHKVLQVGHIERFNPAVLAASQYIHNPQFIEVNRLGPFDPRVADVGVVMDLMIHDLDLVLFLVGEEVKRVEAFGAKVLSNHEDIAKVRLHFANGCIADLSASRVSLQKYRRIRIFQKDAYLSIDYAAPKLKIYQKKGSVVKNLSDIRILTPKLDRQDPLALEIDHFLECVQEGKSPRVSGKHGRDALELARDVLENLQVHG